MSEALADIERNHRYYASRVEEETHRLAVVLEKHQRERERVEAAIAEAIAKRDDYYTVLAAARAALPGDA